MAITRIKVVLAKGASVFWIGRMAAIGGEQAALEHWQIKRDKTTTRNS